MRRPLFYSALLFLVFTWLAGGCELIANFDREKIPGNEPDSGMIPLPPDEDDAGSADAAVDAGEDDAGN